MLAGVALPWLLAVLWLAATRSAAVDEVPHFGAGIALHAHGDFRMNPEHPPLVKWLATLPVWWFARPPLDLAALGLAAPERNPWLLADQGMYGFAMLYYARPAGVMTMLFLARLVPVLFGLLGAVYTFLWGRAIGGPRAGIAAAALLLYYPEYAGNAGLLTFDVPMAAAVAAVCWHARAWWMAPSRHTAAWLALAVGVGALVKMPVTVLAAVVMAQLGVMAWRAGRLWGFVATTAAVAVAWWVTMWAGAGFCFAAVPVGAEILAHPPYIPPVGGDSLLGAVIDRLWQWRVLPESALANWTHVLGFGGRQFFFMGTESPAGSLWYFPLTMAIKSPPALLALGAVAVVMAARAPRRVVPLALLVVPVAMLLAITMLGRVNIGHRHVLFVYTPLAVAAGVALDRLWAMGGRPRLAAGALAVSAMVSFVAAFPNLSTYFNVVGGSPLRASAWVRGSNTDWGADTGPVLRWMRANELPAANLALYGFNPPELFGMGSYRWIDGAGAPPSARPFIGPPNPMLPTLISVNHLDRVRRDHPGLYDRTPDGDFHSILLFLPVVPDRDQ